MATLTELHHGCALLPTYRPRSARAIPKNVVRSGKKPYGWHAPPQGGREARGGGVIRTAIDAGLRNLRPTAAAMGALLAYRFTRKR